MKTNNLNEGRKVHIDVTSREWDTILAALRLWQHDSAHIADGDGALADMAREHGDPLTDADVDKLIERINCSPDSETWALYSDDDGVVLFDTEADAKETAKTWNKAGANGVAGPYGLFR